MGRHRAPEEVSVSKFRIILTFGKPYWAKYRKFIIAALGTAFITFQSVYSGGITAEEWWFIITSALASAGVWKLPNANKKVRIK